MTSSSASLGDAPVWFRDAIADTPSVNTCRVSDASISYRSWGSRELPPLLLIHGGAAHAGWWDHIGPALSDRWRVIAPDLSGHGDSEHRDHYSLEQWADECLAVVTHETARPPTVVGHSLGGFIALTVARRASGPVAHTVVIDSSLTPSTMERWSWLTQLNQHTAKVYPTREIILSRYRTLPEDPASLPYVLRHVAEASIRPTDGGWRWKFDPRIFVREPWDPQDLNRHAGPLSVLLAERGMAGTDIEEVVRDAVPGPVTFRTIDDSGHHVMLDQPLQLLASLSALLGI